MSSETIGAGLVLFLWLGGVIILVVWIALPFILISKLNRIEKVLVGIWHNAEINARYSRTMATNMATTPDEAENANKIG